LDPKKGLNNFNEKLPAFSNEAEVPGLICCFYHLMIMLYQDDSLLAMLTGQATRLWTQ
jgi:hypothetical protein